MKYRVNLYREREEKALRFRQGLLRGAILGSAVGVEFVLIGILLVSGVEIHRRVVELRSSVTRLELQSRNKPDNEGLMDLRKLVRSRVSRVDWTSTLDRVAASIPPGVVLTEIRGGIGGQRGRMDGMELEGRVIRESRDLSPVFVFMEALKADSVIVNRFPSIDLGTAEGQGNSFKIICRPEGESGS